MNDVPLIPRRDDMGQKISQLRPTGSGSAGASKDAEEYRLEDYAGTFYYSVGGKETFKKLTEIFYREVEKDPDFRAMYPEEDLRPAQVRLQLFLEQYWGGPSTYGEHRGHPRLRMRHHPFPVNSVNRDKWLAFMRTALDEMALPQLQDATLWDYFERAAHSLQNTPDN